MATVAEAKDPKACKYTEEGTLLHEMMQRVYKSDRRMAAIAELEVTLTPKDKAAIEAALSAKVAEKGLDAATAKKMMCARRRRLHVTRAHLAQTRTTRAPHAHAQWDRPTGWYNCDTHAHAHAHRTRAGHPLAANALFAPLSLAPSARRSRSLTRFRSRR